MTVKLARRSLSVALVLATLISLTPLVASASIVRSAVRASVTSGGDQATDESLLPEISSGGRYVVFQSVAEDLVPNDNNSSIDVFIHDLQLNVTDRVSLTDSESEANGDSKAPSVSSDGRYVAFQSDASDLISGDTEGVTDIFVRDTTAGSTSRASVSSTETEANWHSREPVISGNGRRVAFTSGASNLVADDDNNRDDVFVRDVFSGITRRISVSAGGAEGNLDSSDAAISSDGRWVVFTSFATNLVPGDTNSQRDIFLYDWNDESIVRVNLTDSGAQANLRSFAPSVSDDGNLVSFTSFATNLVSGDGNARSDIFVRDIAAGTTTRVSVASNGDEGSGHSDVSSISGDGSRVAFHSSADDLVGGDTNAKDDVFLHTLATGTTDKLSTTPEGYQADGQSQIAALDGDGETIAFQSGATNLVPGDSNGVDDIFVVQTGAREYIRVAGQNRYLTAVEASKRAFQEADTVVVATGRNWPDALGGSALAGVVNGPLLLTAPDSLPGYVLEEIDRLGAVKAYILGGEAAVTPAVEAALVAELGASGVQRLAGANRYTTAAAVADEVIALQGSGYDHVALVATGGNYPDALAGSPLAAANGWPILLAHPTRNTLTVPSQVNEAVILGAEGAVSVKVETDLNTLLGSPQVDRKGGADRYGTAALVAEFGVEGGSSWDNVGIATGQNFPDALSGGAMLGAKGSVLLLTRTGSLVAPAQTRLSENASAISTVHLIGGTGAVSQAVEDAVRATVGE